MDALLQHLATNIFFVVIGLAFLYYGAEWLVKGSAEIALRLGISPLVVGLTVVAFGTSAPELLVSVQANLETPPKGDIALGNIVGSNICNIALILGAGALVRPIVVHAQIIRREVPILLVISIVFVAMLWNGSISRWEGGILFAGIIIYVWVSIRQARKEPEATPIRGTQRRRDRSSQEGEPQAHPDRHRTDHRRPPGLGGGCEGPHHGGKLRGDTFRSFGSGDRTDDRGLRHLAARVGHFHRGGCAQGRRHHHRQCHRLLHLQPSSA